MALFQQLEQDRKSDKAPNATGYLEISVADLNEFFSLALALEPVENWKGEPCIKLRCGVWHRETKAGKPWNPSASHPSVALSSKKKTSHTPHHCSTRSLAWLTTRNSDAPAAGVLSLW